MRKLPFQGTLAYAASRLPGGKHAFMEYARLCTEERIKALVHRWESLSPSDQRRVSLEELCVACEVDPPELVGAVAAAAFRFNSDVSTLIAAVAHPKVVEASIDRALQPDGIHDRKMLFQHSAFVPVPASSTINVNNLMLSKVAMAEISGLPDFSDTIMETADVVRDAWKPETDELDSKEKPSGESNS
jgi:hypothetical protein